MVFNLIIETWLFPFTGTHTHFSFLSQFGLFQSFFTPFGFSLTLHSAFPHVHPTSIAVTTALSAHSLLLLMIKLDSILLIYFYHPLYPSYLFASHNYYIINKLHTLK